MLRHLRMKIRCFVYGKRSDVQRQQPDVKSRRTAEESRTRSEYAMDQVCVGRICYGPSLLWTKFV